MNSSESRQYNELKQRIYNLENGLRTMFEMNSVLQMQVEFLRKKVDGEPTEMPAEEQQQQQGGGNLANLQKALGSKPSKSVSIIN